jgi:hypothetical protein
MTEWLKPVVDGFRNYIDNHFAEISLGVKPEEMFRDKAELLQLIPSRLINDLALGLIGALPGESVMVLFAPASVALRLFRANEEYNPADQSHGARNGRQRYIVCLVTSGVNRAQVHDFFFRRVRKASPRKANQPKRDED